MATAWRRAEARGWVRWDVADQLAIELAGVHPAELWPDWWDIEP